MIGCHIERGKKETTYSIFFPLSPASNSPQSDHRTKLAVTDVIHEGQPPREEYSMQNGKRVSGRLKSRYLVQLSGGSSVRDSLKPAEYKQSQNGLQSQGQLYLYTYSFLCLFGQKH